MPRRPNQDLSFLFSHYDHIRGLMDSRSIPDGLGKGCVVWLGALATDGYGEIRFMSKNLMTHRIAWTFRNGKDPGKSLVLHECDVRRCLNAEHLWLGDDLSNAQDRDAKGRGLIKLLDSQDIKQAKELRSQGLTYVEIGHQLGVAPVTVHRCINGRPK